MKKEFYYVLITHKCASKFVQNFANNKSKTFNNVKLALDDYLDRTYPASYICSPFVWSGTKEPDFWALLDSIWCKQCFTNK